MGRMMASGTISAGMFSFARSGVIKLMPRSIRPESRKSPIATSIPTRKGSGAQKF